MAVADMFLKLTGVTGEAQDGDHKGEIQVDSWSWGLQSPAAMGGTATGRTALEELVVTKHVDKSSPTLMQFVRQNKVVPSAVLTIRKAGAPPVEYVRVELSNVRITSLKTHSSSAELVEEIRLGCAKIRVVYTPQAGHGGKGGGEVVFEADAYAGA